MTRIRLAAWDTAGERRLHRGDGLPTVELDGTAQAPPESIVEAARRQLGLDIALLRVADTDLVDVECLGASPAGLRWVADRMSPPPEQRAPWQRPGWVARATATVDAALAGTAWRRRSRPTQVRHTSITGMLRVDTDEQELWFKAAIPLFAHEGAVTRWLAGVAPDAVPAVVAADAGWWLSLPFPAEVPGPAGHFLARMAEIQVATVGRTEALRALDCPDRPLAALVRELRELTGRADNVPAEDRACLAALLDRFESVCAEVSALDIPTTLVHGDLNPENVRWTAAGWFLFDWTDACLSHPFVEVALSLQSVPEPERAAHSRAYARVWETVVPPVAVARGLAAAPVLGAAHQAATYLRLLDAVERSGADRSGGSQLLGHQHHWVRRLISALSDLT